MTYTNEENILLGKGLQEIRENLGYKREVFAELFGLSLDQYKRLERGESRITVDKVALLYRTYHIDPTYLIVGESPDKVDIDYFLANSSKAQRNEFITRVMEYLTRLALS